jgi:hypothetical protein
MSQELLAGISWRSVRKRGNRFREAIEASEEREWKARQVEETRGCEGRPVVCFRATDDGDSLALCALTKIADLRQRASL